MVVELDSVIEHLHHDWCLDRLVEIEIESGDRWRSVDGCGADYLLANKDLDSGILPSGSASKS